METSSRLGAVPRAMDPCRFGDENARVLRLAPRTSGAFLGVELPRLRLGPLLE
jgi:hypothetical protein